MGWLYAALGLLVLLALLSLLAAWLLFVMALRRGARRNKVLKAPHNRVDYAGQMRADYEAAALWWEGIAHEDVHIQAADGLRLHALMVRQPGHDVAICVHGYTGQAGNMRYAGRRFYEKGYSILLPDCRGHGQSEGRYITMGWPDRLDLLGWINHILRLDPQARIVLYGISMGGAAVMMTTGEALPHAVRAIVEDCGYSRLWDEFSYQLRAIFGLPDFPLMPLADWICRLRLGFGMREASAVDQLKKARVPVLFIHGDQDSFVPSHMLEAVYAACSGPKDRLLVPGAGHAQAPHVDPQRYWGHVFDFIDRA